MSWPSERPKATNSAAKIVKSIGLERKLKMEANTLRLTTSMIKIFRIAHSKTKDQLYFTKTDIQALNKACFILDNLDLTPGVKQVSNHVCLNATKIQKRFIQ